MATMLGSLLISLGLNSGQFTKGMSTAQRELVAFQKQAQRTAGAMKDLGAKMTIGITAPLAAFGGLAAKAASDAAEMESAFEVTFGSASGAVKKWAEETGDAMGRSTQEMMGMATSFQDILKKQMDPGAAAELSMTLSVLTQDLASFKNLSNDVAQQKIFSGLIGEAEPLRAVGVLLSAAAVETKALEMGLAKTKKEISEGAKVQARAALIMEQLSDAQGDVIRTSESTANRVKTAAAAFEELQVALGQKLLPALNPIISGLTALITAFTDLPDWVQTSALVVGGFAAIAGPLIYAAGALATNMILLGGAFAGSGAAATGASAGVTLLAGAMRGLLLVGGPLIIALGAIAGVVYLLTRKSREAEAASAGLRAEQERLQQTAEHTSAAIEKLRNSTDAERRATIEAAKAARMKAQEDIRAAKAALARARSELRLADATARRRAVETILHDPGSGLPGEGPTHFGVFSSEQRKLDPYRRQVQELTGDLREAEGRLGEAQALLDAAGAPVALPPVSGTDPGAGTGSGSNSSGSTGPTPADVARDFTERFADDAVRLEMEALQARERLAVGFGERADLQIQMLQLERDERLAAIDASQAELEKSNLTKDQKAALRKQLQAQRQQVEELFGLAEKYDEQGALVVSANTSLHGQQIEQERRREQEQRLADAMRIQFDTKRDHLQLDYDLVDTQEERQRIAAEILKLEQEYRRNQWEMVAASKLSSDAERERANHILASLDALDAKEKQASTKANRTEAERYRDSVNMSAGQINEAIDGIRIDGLDALNDGLVDAIQGVKSLGDVFRNISNKIIADLLRIAIRKAIIGPLADALFGSSDGGGGGLAGLISGASGAAHEGAHTGAIALNGMRAMGGPVLAGGTYLVGENGPELFRASSSGTIVPNHEMAAGGQGGGSLRIALGAGLEAEWLTKAAGQSVEIVQYYAGPMLGAASAQTRRDAARPIMPGGATG